MPKHALRRMLLDRRRKLAAPERAAASRLIQEAFLAIPEFAEARVVAVYAPIHGEVETALVMEQALALGKELLYPTVCGNNLEFRGVKGAADLRPGAYGIPEPAAECPAVAPAMVDLIVIPGVAFDQAGRRIGYGKGFYDRALHPLEGSGKLVGFCFDFQLVEEIAGEPHDVRLDMVITERRLVRCRA